ncbi:MAG TPA: ABC transporter permease [Candidatus Sulfotelmatobacter sp.]
MNGWLQDLRYAVRQLRKSPGFAALAILTLALGIGANTAVFSVIDGVLLRPLPFREPDHLFAVWAESPEEKSIKTGASGPDFQDYREQNRSFEGLAELLPHFTYSLTGQGEPRNVICTGISYDFFPMLGVQPLLGRLYTQEEYHTDGVQVVISERFWKQQLGGDPHVLGRALYLSGGDQTVIGVMPSIPDLFPDTDIWAKVIPDFAWMRLRGNKFLTVIGRTKPGISRAQAEQDLTAILRRAPGGSSSSVKLIPLKDEFVGHVRAELDIIAAAVGLVLVIACVNVMGLLLARSAKLQSEIAVRLGLGASHKRIVQQLVAENLLLSVLGGTLGVALAVWGVRLATSFNFGNLPRSHSIQVNATVLGIALLVTFSASLLLAWGPSVTFSRLDITSALKSGRGQIGKTNRRGLQLLIVSEVSLALVLLVGAGLLFRSFRLAARSNPGFQPEQLLETYLRTNYYDAAGATFYKRILESVSSLPGVQATGVSDCVPANWAPTATLTFNDRPADPKNAPTTDACWINTDYFRATGTPLFRGRLFTPHDDEAAPAVVIVNRAMAQTYWPGQDPIGKRFAVNYVGPGRDSNAVARFREVVGVVENVKQRGLDVSPEPALYLPFLQDPTHHVFAGMHLFVRTTGDPINVAGSLRARVHSIKSDQPINEIRTMDSIALQTLATRRLGLQLMGAFATLALVLSSLGLYGAIAYSVSQRTREFGLRIALGGRRQDVLVLVMKEGLWQALSGITVGTIAALAAARAMAGLLFGVTSTDPVTFVGVALVLLATTVAACYIPARRATKIDPMVALRYE